MLKKKKKIRPEDLITYCGIYGGQCARWCGYTQFRQLVATLAEWLDAQGYQYWMQDYAKEFSYKEFRKGIDFFSKNDTWLVCTTCCKGPNGWVECAFRKCCIKRMVSSCFECVEFPCARARKNKAMMKRAAVYKRLGKRKWLEIEMKKARRGFEIHTKKYYQIRSRKTPFATTT